MQLQGFLSVAEVDVKGRARRLPIKAGIRKALSFPGGSTLMVSHLKQEASAHSAASLKLTFPLEPNGKSSSSAIEILPFGVPVEGYNTLTTPKQITSRSETSQPGILVNYELPGDDMKLHGR